VVPYVSKFDFKLLGAANVLKADLLWSVGGVKVGVNDTELTTIGLWLKVVTSLLVTEGYLSARVAACVLGVVLVF
jgi:hypothetical protein